MAKTTATVNLVVGLAKEGNKSSSSSERIEETIDPEQAIDRAFETYLKKGYSKEWIGQRLFNIKIRNNLTDEWDSVALKKVLNMQY